MEDGDSGADVSAELEATLDVIGRHYVVDDWDQYKIVLAAAVAHYLPGEMLWMKVYGPSRSGKTSLLKPMLEHDDVVPLEAVTPAAFRGGLNKGKKVLKRLDGKLVVTKELAAMLGTRSETRRETFSLLRAVKDGGLVADYGHDGDEAHLEQKASFDWILAVTEAVADYRSINDSLGARFVDLHWQSADRKKAAVKAAENQPHIPAIQAEVAGAIVKLFDAAKAVASTDTPPVQGIAELADLADIAAMCRTPVRRTYGNKLSYPPSPELGTELSQAFARIAGGLSLLGISDSGPFIARLARDSMPEMRLRIIQQLGFGRLGVNELARRTKLPATTVHLELQDMEVIEVVHSNQDGCWSLASSVLSAIDDLAAPVQHSEILSLPTERISGMR